MSEGTKFVTIKGARTHNLKNISLTFPRDQLVIITGLSGSGKSSLAFDTIYAEGQRRYIESLSSYARQFLARLEKPDVDYIHGLSPAVAIEQKKTSHNPRSTVGTITEVQDYLRLMYARVGTPRCPRHGKALSASTVTQMVERVLEIPGEPLLMLLAPVIRDRKGEFSALFESLKAQGFSRMRVDGKIIDTTEPLTLNPKQKHSIEVVIDRFRSKAENRLRISESLETALRLSEGIVLVMAIDGDMEAITFSARFACPECGYSLKELEPRLFSFNSPMGACKDCAGLGVVSRIDESKLVLNSQLSLSGGAIARWSRRNRFNYRLLRRLARHSSIELDKPYRLLKVSERKLLLYGGETRVAGSSATPSGGKKLRFSGIIPIMSRHLNESESDAIKMMFSQYMSSQHCPTCRGARLNEAACHVFINGVSLPALTALTIDEALSFFKKLNLPTQQAQIADKIVQEIQSRLNFLSGVGIGYLTLNRKAETLSGGEAQRIRLAGQIGAGLTGVMYILDEPSIGLHQRDNKRLLDTLFRLRDLGNTVIVVEHDEEAIRSADHIIDIGPAAGKQGGEVVAQGQLEDIQQCQASLTGAYLSGRMRTEIPPQRRAFKEDKVIVVHGMTGNNLKNVEMRIPLGLFVCVTGVSGSGKSTAVNETLTKRVMRHLHKTDIRCAPCKKITGLENIDRMIHIDQSPIGRTPRSNPATYTGLFSPIRALFAGVPEARARGYAPGRFSFNVKGGRCEACRGDGLICVEMHFLPAVYVKCDVCQGKRYSRETLDIRYKNKNIIEVLEMSVAQARDFFQAVPAIKRKLDTLTDVGLSYLTLGQNATTLSGGEAQRVKLSCELSKKDTGNTLYFLDEPTTGLHFHDIKQLLGVLNRLCDLGNTVVVVEHNLDVIKCADWIVDLGPEGGDGGGEIVATGTPEQLAEQCKRSWTGLTLKDYFARYQERYSYDSAP